MNIRKKCKIDSSLKEEVSFGSNTNAFVYYELVIESVIMAYMALEAFLNEHIPEDYECWSNRRSERILEASNNEKIERHFTNEEKITIILPEVLCVESPKGRSKAWENYKKLHNLRNRLVHMKTLDRRSSGPETETIWDSLLKVEAPHRLSKSIIDYFIKRMPNPPEWYNKCPIRA
ncbi:MAG: hypothetical protein K9K75_02105 [Deltaproteobacteria bacterium]|nr:hypothetical protein [Deltaproteobacteria bacterium]